MQHKAETAVVLSTRGRPKSLLVAVGSILKTATREGTRVVVGFDDDDDVVDLPECVIKIVGPRPDSLGEKFDRLAKSVHADLYVYACDDIAYLTQGWDQQITEAATTFGDGIGAVYGGVFPDAVSPIPAVRALTRRLVDLIGYFCPPHFPFWFDDTWMDEICRYIDRIVMVDVDVGLIGGRGQTRGCRDLAWWQTWFDNRRPWREDIARAIICDMDESATRKLMLRRRFPMLRDWFFQRGANLRDQQVAADYAARHGFETGPDERYMRLRSAAEKLAA